MEEVSIVHVRLQREGLSDSWLAAQERLLLVTLTKWKPLGRMQSSIKTASRRSILTSKGFRLVRGNGTKVSQIALVSDEHDNNVAVSVVTELLEPPRHIDIGRVLGNVVYKQGTDGTAVVCRCDGTVSLLSCGIPDLCFNRLSVNRDASSSELDTDSGLGLETELVTCESREQVGFTGTTVTDQYHLEKVIVVGFRSHDDGRCDRVAKKEPLGVSGRRVVYGVGSWRGSDALDSFDCQEAVGIWAVVKRYYVGCRSSVRAAV